MSFVDRVEKAKNLALSFAKEEILLFLQTSPEIPRKTGKMAQSAIDNLFQSFDDIDVWFNTIYADDVEERTQFIEKITEQIYSICEESQKRAFKQYNLEITF